MARIARILLWSVNTLSRRILRSLIFAVLVGVAVVAVVVAGLPDQLLRGQRSDVLAILIAGGVVGVAAFLANLAAGLVSTQIKDGRTIACQQYKSSFGITISQCLRGRRSA